jgi:hypothetical protein
VLDDGTVVEWVFSDAELVESSAVNVPAVVGTGIAEFRAALSAHFDQQPGQPSQTEKPEEKQMAAFKSLLAVLSLSAEASEEAAIAAVEKLRADKIAADERAGNTELELKAERQAHDASKALLTELQAKELQLRVKELDGKIAALYQEGKLVHELGGKPDAYEATLREIHEKLGAEKFSAAAARLAQKVPTGRQAGDEDPSKLGGGSDNVIVLSDRQKKMVGQMGMTEEQFQNAMKRGGKF